MTTTSDVNLLPLMPLIVLTTQPRTVTTDMIRALCRNAYLGGSDALTRVLGRYKMYVDTSDVGISSHILLDGYWEIWVTEAIAALVKPGMVVADVGANLGYYTMLMADLVGPTGRVHAFEPNPVMLRRLRRNIAVNGFAGHTDVHDKALADVDGAIVPFHIPPDFPGGGAIARHSHPNDSNTIQIETIRLDARPEWHAIELIKVDVEGAEELVWRGARGLLEGDKLRTVLLEFNTERYADSPGFLAAMRAHGFSIGLIEPDQGMISVSEEALLTQYANNEVMLLLQR